MRNRHRRPLREIRPPGFREALIRLAIDFCRKAANVRGVKQNAFIGSITTPEPHPKDIDLVVTIGEDVDMEALAKAGRQLKGGAQALSSGADIFLADEEHNYLGRTCSWNICEPGIRLACKAQTCGRVQFLYDDLQIIQLPSKLISNPPLIVFPQIEATASLPADLRDALDLPTSDFPGG